MIELANCTLDEIFYCNRGKLFNRDDELIEFIGSMSLIGSQYVDIGTLDKKQRLPGSFVYNTEDEIPFVNKIGDEKIILSITQVNQIKSPDTISKKGVDYLRYVISSENDIDELRRLTSKLKKTNLKMILNIELPKSQLPDIKPLKEKIDFNYIYAVIIDDVYGCFNESDWLRFINLLDNLFDKKIKKGIRIREFYLENYINIIDRIEKKSTELIVESTIKGISRNIQISNLADLAIRLNINQKNKYNINHIAELEAIILRGVKGTEKWKKDYLCSILQTKHADFNHQKYAISDGSTYAQFEKAVSMMPIKIRKKATENDYRTFITRAKSNSYKNRICVLVLVDGNYAAFEKYLIAEAAVINKSKIDVFFLSDQINKKCMAIYKKYKRYHISNIHFLSGYSFLGDALEFLATRYDYTWINQIEYIIQYLNMDYYILPLLDYDFDVIQLENDWFSVGKKGIVACKEGKNFFEKNYASMYSFGVTVYSSKLLMSSLKNCHKKTEQNLIFQLFSYIINHNGKYVNVYGDFYLLDNINCIFKIDQYEKKWTVDLPIILDKLKCNLNYEEDISSSFYNPFSIHRILNYKSKSKHTLKHINKLSLSKRMLTYLPASCCDVLLKHEHNKILCKTREKKNKIKNVISELRKPYNGIDFDRYVNCFVPMDKVEVDLLFGNLDYIKNPWITIVIPTYKRADLLKQALSSVLKQKSIGHEWDIIVIDNEEVDSDEKNETQQLIEKINHPRILYYRNQRNIGVAGNYNRGIELARGKWVSLLHSDDLLVDGYLSRIEHMIELYNNEDSDEIGYISPAYWTFQSEDIEHDPFWKVEMQRRNAEIRKYQKRNNTVLVRVPKSELIITGCTGVSLPSNGTVLNRSAVIEVGGFNDNLGICADMVLPLRLMDKYAVYRTVEVLGHYRVGNSNISSSVNNAYEVEKNYNEIREYYYRKSLLGKCMKALFSQQHFFVIDSILGNPYSWDESLKALKSAELQKKRDKIFWGKFGIFHNYYRLQNKRYLFKNYILEKKHKLCKINL